jgi:hypothetical protein
MGNRFDLNKLELEDMSDEPKVDEASLQKEAVAFSVKVVEALSSKMEEHNGNCDNKVNLKDLKKVYIRGAKDCSDSKNTKESCIHQALARINMFLRIKQGDQISLNNDFETDSEAIDISEGWIPSEKDFDKAEEEITKFDLNHDFLTADDLYLESYERVEWEW